MDLFLSLKEKLDISDDDFKDISKNLLSVKETIDNEEIEFGEQFEIGFYSHMISLLMRLKNNEKIDEVDMKVLDEIDEKVLEIAKKIVAPYFDKYKTKQNLSEIILVATHIQIAFNMRGGEENVR